MQLSAPPAPLAPTPTPPPQPTPRARINRILEKEMLGKKEEEALNNAQGTRGGGGRRKLEVGLFLKWEVGNEETARNDCCNYGHI